MDTDKVVQDLNRRFAAPLPGLYQRHSVHTIFIKKLALTS